MEIVNLCDIIDFPIDTCIDDIVEKSMKKWIEKNVSSSRAVRLSTTKLEIYVEGKKTGWFIDSSTYNVYHGICYNTTSFGKLQCYEGYEDGLDIIK